MDDFLLFLMYLVIIGLMVAVVVFLWQIFIPLGIIAAIVLFDS